VRLEDTLSSSLGGPFGCPHRLCTDPGFNFWRAAICRAQQARTFSPAANKAQSSIAMATIHNRMMRPCLAWNKTAESVLAFLVPSAQCMRNAPAARFSTSPIRCKKDNNTNRGISAVRGTGLRPRQTLSVLPKKGAQSPIPKPERVEEKVTGTPNHGLWDFFKDQQLLQTPVQEHSHGTQHEQTAALARC
jgi:hypothetical protein